MIFTLLYYALIFYNKVYIKTNTVFMNNKMSYGNVQILEHINKITDAKPYVILPKYLVTLVGLINISKLIAPFNTKGAPIFQTLEQNDKLRLQLPGSESKEIQLVLIHQAINLLVNLIGCGNLILSPLSILVSLAGCMEQQLHYDFNMEKITETKQSYLLIADITKNTKLVIYTNNIKHTVQLHAGDLLIGRGDLIHAGAAYDKKNVCMFVCIGMLTICATVETWLRHTYTTKLSTLLLPIFIMTTF